MVRCPRSQGSQDLIQEVFISYLIQCNKVKQVILSQDSVGWLWFSGRAYLGSSRGWWVSWGSDEAGPAGPPSP